MKSNNSFPAGLCETFPAHTGYLHADPQAVAAWQSRLDALGGGPKIGIVWRSSLTAYERQRHYSELTDWQPLLSRCQA